MDRSTSTDSMGWWRGILRRRFRSRALSIAAMACGPKCDASNCRRSMHGFQPIRRGFGTSPELWNKELADLKGPVLYLDLDILITGTLDDFFDYGEDDDVVLAVNPVRPLERLGQTSIYRFPVGKLAPLKTAFEAAPEEIARRYRYEQRFVTRTAPGGVRFWPRRWVRLFRHDLMPPFPLNLFTPPRLPGDAKVVLFAGHLKPPEAISGRWMPDNAVRTPNSASSRDIHRQAA